MGLDMYLDEKIYVGANYEHNSVLGTIEIYRRGEKLDIDFNKVTYIILSLGYWRKANAIHKWFVDNVQGGEDNCGTYYVSGEKLQTLLNTVIQVLGNHELAHQLLPTENGFFFGGTDYDEWYYEDLNYTKELIEGIAKTHIKISQDGEEYISGDFEYHSSW